MILQKLHFYFITQIRQVLSNSGAIAQQNFNKSLLFYDTVFSTKVLSASSYCSSIAWQNFSTIHNCKTYISSLITWKIDPLAYGTNLCSTNTCQCPAPTQTHVIPYNCAIFSIFLLVLTCRCLRLFWCFICTKLWSTDRNTDTGHGIIQSNHRCRVSVGINTDACRTLGHT